MSAPTDDSWWTYLISDPKVVGVVGWLSLLATLVGFGIAIVQLRKVKTAFDAAVAAAHEAQATIRSHEQSSKISAAMEFINSADAQIQRSNSEAAGAYLSIAWSVLIEAKELTVVSRDRDELGDHIRQVKRLVDDIRAPLVASDVSQQLLQERHFAISQALGGLGTLAARVRMKLSGVGGGGND